VPETGHFIMLEQPQLIADWVAGIMQVDDDNHPEKSGSRNQTKSRENVT